MVNILYTKTSELVKSPDIATIGSAGIDFYAPKSFLVNPREDILIDLEICIQIPKNYCLLLVNKSSIAYQQKLILGACLIDSDYRGHIHAHFFSMSDNIINIQKDKKIVQGIIVPCGSIENITLENVLTLTQSDRGNGGFGSTNV